MHISLIPFLHRLRLQSQGAGELCKWAFRTILGWIVPTFPHGRACPISYDSMNSKYLTNRRVLSLRLLFLDIKGCLDGRSGIRRVSPYRYSHFQSAIYRLFVTIIISTLFGSRQIVPKSNMTA